MSQDSVRKITKSNVAKARQLVMKHNTERKRRNVEEVTNNCKVTCYCKRFQGSKRSRTALVGFSKNLALLEMQSYIARQDWKHALNLFPRLLECPIELEPLIWRYAFIILLHTNDPLHLHQFFSQCIGSHSSNNSILLEKLLLLPLEDDNSR
ncbi:PREDICTED: uncharacterized protein LOC105144104 [Acromyrmex echinatior]|uniref:Uncharacterized protein n=1 Tax=Acromyrmex echinatior TaxID=103372 RepID=F4WE26_ACREC|nr:PREDICTED: uncharacterized protein LOC105144104 [Acromyrmex echinatior]EGI67464.1 hypothetical protein G5I_03857 [Acromyrmex echinatior]